MNAEYDEHMFEKQIQESIATNALTVVTKDIQSPGVLGVFSPDFAGCGLERAQLYVRDEFMLELRKHVSGLSKPGFTMKELMLNSLGEGFLQARDEGIKEEMEILALTMAEVIGRPFFVIVENSSKLEIITSLNASGTTTASDCAMIVSSLANLTAAGLARIDEITGKAA
jgi:hypothetical protein